MSLLDSFLSFCVNSPVPAAGLFAVLLLWAVDSKRRHWLLWVLALFPVFALYYLSDDHRVYSYHGFMHHSIVYEILDGVIPPTNPILAGEPLRYPWGAFVLIAFLAKLLDTSPPWAFALANVASLVLTLVFLYRAARKLRAPPSAAILGVAVAIFSGVYLHYFSLVEPVAREETRALPVLNVFMITGGMALGIMCYSLFLLAVSAIVTDERASRRPYLLLFLSALLCLHLYPIIGFGMLAGGAVALAVLVLLYPKGYSTRAIWSTVAVVAAVVLSLPYAMTLRGSDGSSFVQLASSGQARLWFKHYYAPFLPLLGLILCSPVALWKALRPVRPLALVLLVISGVNCFLCIFTSGPVLNAIDYKYRALSFIPLGLFAGVSLDFFRRRSALLLVPILTLMMWFNFELLGIRSRPTPIPDGYYESGIDLRHVDPAQDELFQWIAGTAPRSAFVDDERTIPVFGHRSLFVALDSRWRGGGHWRDGWFFAVETKIQSFLGGREEEVKRRVRLTKAALAGRDLDELVAAFEEMRERGTGEEFYIVLRDKSVSPVYERDARFDEAFSNERFSVFRYSVD